MYVWCMNSHTYILRTNTYDACMHAGTLLNFDENSYIIMTSLENVIVGFVKTLPKSMFPANFDQVLTLLYFCMRATINHVNPSTVANIVINKITFAVSLISSKPIITSTYKTARNISTCRVFRACSIQWALIFIYMEMVKEINLWGFSISQSQVALYNKSHYCNPVFFILH